MIRPSRPRTRMNPPLLPVRRAGPATSDRRSRIVQRVVFTLVLLCASATARAQHEQRFGLWPTQANGALRLVRHDVQVQIEHPLAETTVTQEFWNPTARSLEAYYYYPVPAGATVSGLALWVNGKRREARVLERQKAREIYQGIVNEQRDPALVEKLDDTLFRIRIFPVLPKRRQRVELRFIQPVESSSSPNVYRYQLDKPPGPPIDVLRFGLRLRAQPGIASARLTGIRANLRQPGPDGWWVSALPAARGRFGEAVRLSYRLRRASPTLVSHVADGKRIFVAELPRRSSTPSPASDHTMILVDRSRSMHAHGPQATRVAQVLARRAARTGTVSLIPFDLIPLASAKAMSPDGAAAAVARLAEPARALGTAFLPTFRAALDAKPTRIVCLSDGGDRYHQRELERVLRLVFDRRGEVAISFVTFGEVTNAGPLRDIARISGGLYRKVTRPNELERLSEALLSTRAPTAARLQQAAGTRSLTIVRADPHRLLVTGDLPANARVQTIQIRADGRTHRLGLPSQPSTSRPAEGLWAKAAIEQLMDRIKLFGEENATIDRIIALSQAHGIASEYTALLVTETDADYQRPTSGRRWQRQTRHVGDDMPPGGFSSAPEPHEYALIALALFLLHYARRRGWLGSPSQRTAT
jgi:hypothetical protein